MDRKKALIITYAWPPMEGVGLIRALKFAKYLPLYGWDPVVLTVGSPAVPDVYPAGGIKVVRTGYLDVVQGLTGALNRLGFRRARNNGTRGQDSAISRCDGRGVSLARELITMPDDQIGWYNFAVREGGRVIGREGIDILFSTSPPETAHLIARSLGERYMLPWIADLRDLWSDDHFRRRSRLKRSVLRFIEKRVLKDAKAIVTVSEPWADKLRSTLGCARDRVKVIENGFDEEDFASADYGKNEKFTITYTGKLHKEHQDISIFFRALSELVKKGDVDINKMHVRFYVLGHDRPDLMKLAEAYGISAAIEEAGKVNFIKSAEAQRASDALLFVQWQGAGQDGWCSAKLYDYIGSGRPIIAIAGKGGIIDEIISRTSSGTVADALDPLKAEISRLYNEHARNGRIEHTGNDGEIAACSRKLKAKQLAGLFDSALTSKGAR